MSTPAFHESLSTLVAYHQWAGERLLDAAARAPAEELVVDGLSQGTLFQTLLHILDVSYSWRLAAEGAAETRMIWEVEPLETLEAVRDCWRRENEKLSALVAGLSAEDLDREVTPAWRREPFRLWQIIMHIVLHQVEHGNEAGWRLTQLGQSPGEMAFMGYINQVARKP